MELFDRKPGRWYLGKKRSRVCASDKGTFFTTRKSLKGVQNSRKKGTESLKGVQKREILEKILDFRVIFEGKNPSKGRKIVEI